MIKKPKFLYENGSQNSFADGPNVSYALRSQPCSSESLKRINIDIPVNISG